MPVGSSIGTGQKSGRFFVQIRRSIPIEDVSDHFINALIAAEDPRFYSHNGVDYKGILRAVYSNYRNQKTTTGASTISQQLVRDTVDFKRYSISRGVTEIFLAHRLEKELGDKQRILELFVNRTYFGEGYYGIASAAKGFFDKEAKDLTIDEAAALAGVIRNPYYRSPRKYPASCKKTRDAVLERMLSEKYITHEEKRTRSAYADCGRCEEGPYRKIWIYL